MAKQLKIGNIVSSPGEKVSGFFTVAERAASKIDLPMNPPLLDLLRLPFKFTREEIERSGLTHLVQQAEDERDALIAKAVKILQPLI